MAAEDSRKLLCFCGKHLGTFDEQGLQLKCRHCEDVTTVPYRLGGLRDAIAFAQQRRRQARRPEGGPGVRKNGH